MIRKKIHVTAEDIANGVREAPKDCPVALALTRETSLPDILVIGGWTSSAFKDVAYVELPHDALTFMGNFDEGIDVSPFNFWTKVPDAT